jgi:HK97 family phage major capsid protein
MSFLKYELEKLSNMSAQIDDTFTRSDLNREVAEVFNTARKGSNNNFFRAVDLFLISNPVARNEFNYHAQQKGLPQVSYPLLSRALLQNEVIDKETFNRASGDLDTLTNPGGANMLQVTVANYFEKTVEQLGAVFSTVTKRDLRNGGNLKQPVYSAFAKSTWVAAGVDYVDLGTTIEGGMSSVTLDPLPFGHNLQVFTDFVNKLSVTWLQETLEIMAEAHARAKDDAILNGSGSAQPTGMNQNALVVNTNFAPGADEFETLLNACTAISDARKIGGNRLAIYGNEAINNRLVSLKYNMTNPDLAGLINIDGNGSVKSIAGKRFIQTEVISNTGSSPSKSAVATVGIPELYIWGYSKEDQVKESEHLGFKSDTLFLKASGIADGKPAFNNAFAKVTFSNVA